MKTVIICGKGESFKFFKIYKDRYPDSDVYSLNNHEVPGATHHFEMHLRIKNNVSKSSSNRIIVHPFYEHEDLCQDLLDQDADFFISEKFPIDVAANEFDCLFYSSTACYMMAYAMIAGAERIILAGIDFVTDREISQREASGMRTWIQIARDRGVEIDIAYGSSLHSNYDVVDLSETYCYGLESADSSYHKRFEKIASKHKINNKSKKTRKLMKYYKTNNATLPSRAGGKTFRFEQTKVFGGQMHGVTAVPYEQVKNFQAGMGGRPFDEISREQYESEILNSPIAKANGITPIPDPAQSMIQKQEEPKAPDPAPQPEEKTEASQEASEVEEPETEQPEPEKAVEEKPASKPKAKKKVSAKKTTAPIKGKGGVTVDPSDKKAVQDVKDGGLPHEEDIVAQEKITDGEKA